MEVLETAPGVMSVPARAYVESADVMILLGCRKSKASDYI